VEGFATGADLGFDLALFGGCDGLWFGWHGGVGVGDG
jgi:hypothetical protein